jgi:hypothetical protein
MPLFDHFHPPLLIERPWESFHAVWAGLMLEHFNSGGLPPEHFAAIQVRLGGGIEVDVGSFRRRSDATLPAVGPMAGAGTAVAVAPSPAATGEWTAPEPDLVVESVFPDDIEVQVISTTSGPTLVGAIELVSPANKDRPESRRAFAAKCAAYLQRGIGLVVVDIVTSRLANLHNELFAWLGHGESARMSGDPAIYAVAYRPVRRGIDRDLIEMWRHPLALGRGLPTVPFALRGSITVPLDLDRSYTAACRRSLVG